MVWPMSKSQSRCVLMCRRGSGWLCRREGRGGREEVVTHQLTAHTARVNSTGGDKQEVLHVHTCTDVGTACTILSSQCPYVCAHTDTHT